MREEECEGLKGYGIRDRACGPTYNGMPPLSFIFCLSRLRGKGGVEGCGGKRRSV